MKRVFAAVHESGYGTKLPFWDVRYPVATEGKSDIAPRADLVAIDPKETSAARKKGLLVIVLDTAAAICNGTRARLCLEWRLALLPPGSAP